MGVGMQETGAHRDNIDTMERGQDRALTGAYIGAGGELLGAGTRGALDYMSEV
jgi:hypothetical protein